tara:strand:+ start:372 stop:1187 length:816 start_codon:yes stop_codon:yes gene_type:complete
MAINLDKINAAIEKLDPTKNSSGGNNQDDIIKLDEGEHVLRIAPYKHDLEMPFQELWFHFGIAGRTFLCPTKMKGESDPICDFATKCWDQFKATGDESFKEMFKNMAPKNRAYIPVIKRGEEDKGIRWWSVSPRTTYKDILDLVKSALRQGVDITDENEGLDLVVKMEHGFNNWLVPSSVITALKPSPLASTKKEIQTIIDSVKPIDELFQFAPVEEMKLALEKHVNPNADDSDSSAGTEKNFAPAAPTKVAAEEDTVSEKITNAFDQLLA